MKHWTFMACLLAVLLWQLYLPVSAGSYVDNLRDMDNNTIKSYQNLQPITNSQVPADVQTIVGPMAFTFQNYNRLTATASYRIQGAESVTVQIYTWLGTFVSEVPGYSGTYAAGMPFQDMGHIYSQTLYPLLLGGDQTLYCYIGGNLHKIRGTDQFYRADRVSDAPGNLIPYGVNVYAVEGDSRRPIPLSRQRVSMGAQCVFEEFSGSVPANTTQVVVEINDFMVMDLVRPNGSISSIKPATGMRTILRQVSFTGNNLRLGTPEPLIPPASQPTDSQSSSSSEKASSTKKSTSKKSSQKSSTASTSISPKKFTGEVTSIVSGSKASKSSSRGKKASSGHDAATSTTDSPSNSIPPEPSRPDYNQIFQLSPGGGKPLRIAPMVLGFTLLITGVLVVVMLDNGAK